MKLIYKVLFAVVYTIGYFFLALLSTGGGHGNFYLLSPALSWVFSLIAVLLLGRMNYLAWRIFFIGVMAIHYLLICFVLLNYPFSEDKGWTRYGLAYIPIVWYVVGQIFIWAKFISEIINGERKIDA